MGTEISGTIYSLNEEQIKSISESIQNIVDYICEIFQSTVQIIKNTVQYIMNMLYEYIGNMTNNRLCYLALKNKKRLLKEWEKFLCDSRNRTNVKGA